jgi:hypothetical protein
MRNRNLSLLPIIAALAMTSPYSMSATLPVFREKLNKQQSPEEKAEKLQAAEARRAKKNAKRAALLPSND